MSCDEGGKRPGEGRASSFSMSVDRAMELLGLFGPERTEIGVSEMSRALKLPKASVQRMVLALVRHDFLDQSPQSRKYRIGIGAFQVGSLFVNSRRLERTAEPVMRETVAELGHTCQFSVLRSGLMVVTASVEGSGPIKYSVPVGYQLPLSTSAVGKAMLSLMADDEIDAILARGGMPRRTPHSVTDPGRLKAELHATRERGYSVNWEENQPGVGSVAAPIVSPDGRPAAVLSIGFPVSFVARSEIPSLGKAIVSKATDVARQLWQGHALRESAFPTEVDS